MQQGGGSGDKPARPVEGDEKPPASSPTPSSPLARDDGRLTLQFAAVTLALPDGFDDTAREDEPAAEKFPLELDTGELHVPPADVARAPTPSSELDLDLSGLDPLEAPRISLPETERVSREPLDLELPTPAPPPPAAAGEGPFGELRTKDFEVVPEKEGIAMVHDAWTRDRMARRAPTPMPTAAAVPLATRPTRQLRAQRRTPEGTASAGGALDLVDGVRPRSAAPDGLAGEMSERYALGDFTGALRIAELLLGGDAPPDDARRYADAARERLVAIYTSRIGGIEHVPVVAVRETDVRWLGLDHRAAFLLSRVDGESTLEAILDVSGMPRLDALKIVVELYESGAIRWR